MDHHRHSFAIGEMGMLLEETSEQQRINDLKEQLEQEKKSHKETKSQLEIAEIKLSNRASEVKELRNVIKCLVLHEEKSAKDNFEAKNESKFQTLKSELENMNKKLDDYKLKSDKKFDSLKEQISKGQNQEELQKLQETNVKLESEKEVLQEELSYSITETKFLEQKIEEFEETDIEKDEKIQELEEIIKQNGSKFDELEKELSDVVDAFEKKDLDYENLKKKYEEAFVKLNEMSELRKFMNDIEFKYSQLQQQNQQLQQQLDEKTDDHQSSIDDLSQSKELREYLSIYKKCLDACLKKSDLALEFSKAHKKRYYNLSKEEQKKCSEIGRKYYQDYMKKKKNSQ